MNICKKVTNNLLNVREDCRVSGGLRFAPAPPNVSCVPASGNLYPSGPSPYTWPRVDKPPDTLQSSQ